jgi:hypothetical protein
MVIDGSRWPSTALDKNHLAPLRLLSTSHHNRNNPDNDRDIRHFEKSIFKSPAQKIEFLSTDFDACGMTVS